MYHLEEFPITQLVRMVDSDTSGSHLYYLLLDGKAIYGMDARSDHEAIIGMGNKVGRKWIAGYLPMLSPEELRQIDEVWEKVKLNQDWEG